ncbi:MAG: response regulator [Candidatus Nomurabacteria bacterium]|jgi:DNA-binding response OmpR family regulator|nr:response regulator [Candidatus Nomurabacteria bacterium]
MEVGEAPKKKILIVEDDAGLAQVYRDRLEIEGFETVEAHNGEDALVMATKERPDLILLDVMMPKINGFDVLDILKNTPETMNIHVLMLSALADEDNIIKSERMGADDYMIKSQVVIDDMVNKIREVLETF